MVFTSCDIYKPSSSSARCVCSVFLKKRQRGARSLYAGSRTLTLGKHFSYTPTAWSPVRDPTTWTILQQDGPNHFRLWYNVLPEHKIALITPGPVPFRPSGSLAARSMGEARMYAPQSEDFTTYAWQLSLLVRPDAAMHTNPQEDHTGACTVAAARCTGAAVVVL